MACLVSAQIPSSSHPLASSWHSLAPAFCLHVPHLVHILYQCIIGSTPPKYQEHVKSMY